MAELKRKRESGEYEETPSKKCTSNIKLGTAQDKRDKLILILEREIETEINTLKSHLGTVEDRIFQAKQCLIKVRQAVVSEFYRQENTRLLQRPLHPAVKKILNGKEPSSYGTEIKREKLEEFCEDSENSNVTSSMNNVESYSSDSNSNDEQYSTANCLTDVKNSNEINDSQVKEERSNYVREDFKTTDKVKNTETIKVPRYIPPKQEDKAVIKLCQLRVNSVKRKIRFVIGNVSKWLGPESKDATHKWTAYVKTLEPNIDLMTLISKAKFFLHPSFKPNDIIQVEKPPIKITRRGWGEFALRVQLHFYNESNKPVDLIHHLKFDRTHTGMETFGAETVADVWLYLNDEISNEGLEGTRICKESCKPVVANMRECKELKNELRKMKTESNQKPKSSIRIENLLNEAIEKESEDSFIKQGIQNEFKSSVKIEEEGVKCKTQLGLSPGFGMSSVEELFIPSEGGQLSMGTEEEISYLDESIEIDLEGNSYFSETEIKSKRDFDSVDPCSFRSFENEFEENSSYVEQVIECSTEPYNSVENMVDTVGSEKTQETNFGVEEASEYSIKENGCQDQSDSDLMSSGYFNCAFPQISDLNDNSFTADPEENEVEQTIELKSEPFNDENIEDQIYTPKTNEYVAPSVSNHIFISVDSDRVKNEISEDIASSQNNSEVSLDSETIDLGEMFLNKVIKSSDKSLIVQNSSQVNEPSMQNIETDLPPKKRFVLKLDGNKLKELSGKILVLPTGIKKTATPLVTCQKPIDQTNCIQLKMKSNIVHQANNKFKLNSSNLSRDSIGSNTLALNNSNAVRQVKPYGLKLIPPQSNTFTLSGKETSRSLLKVSGKNVKILNPQSELNKNLSGLQKTLKTEKLIPKALDHKVPQKIVISLPPGSKNFSKPVVLDDPHGIRQGNKVIKQSILLNNSLIVQKKVIPGVSLLKKPDPKVEPQIPTESFDSDLKYCPSKDVESAVKWLVKRFPLVDKRASFEKFKSKHPYCAPNESVFLSWPLPKQRAGEWLRAKTIGKYLTEVCPDLTLWTTVEILKWCRARGFTPVSRSKDFKVELPSEPEVNFPCTHIDIKQFVEMCKKLESEEDVDIITVEKKKSSLEEFQESLMKSNSTKILVPLEDEHMELGKFIENHCKEIGSLFSGEEIVDGLLYPASLRLMISVFKSLTEDLIRRSYESAWDRFDESPPSVIDLIDVKVAISGREEFDVFTNEGLGAPPDASTIKGPYDQQVYCNVPTVVESILSKGRNT